MDKHFIYKEKH